SRIAVAATIIPPSRIVRSRRSISISARSAAISVLIVASSREISDDNSDLVASCEKSDPRVAQDTCDRLGLRLVEACIAQPLGNFERIKRGRHHLKIGSSL